MSTMNTDMHKSCNILLILFYVFSIILFSFSFEFICLIFLLFHILYFHHINLANLWYYFSQLRKESNQVYIKLFRSLSCPTWSYQSHSKYSYRVDLTSGIASLIEKHFKQENMSPCLLLWNTWLNFSHFPLFVHRSHCCINFL